MADWTLDSLKAELSKRPEVKAWVLTREHVHRRERYFLGEAGALATDQDRDVHAQSIYARVIVRSTSPDRQGEISQKLFPTLPLELQIDAALAAARETDHQAWELPSQLPAHVPTPRSADPRMAEDLEGVMGQVSDQVRAAVAKRRDALFSSAELFLSIHDRELHLSNGLTHRSSQSRAYVEAAYSNSAKTDEYLNSRWSVSLDDLKVGAFFDETAARAGFSVDVRKPTTGTWPVLIDADVLATLLNGHVSQLSGGNAYNGLPFVKPGDALIPEAAPGADKITLTLDPTLDFGADTTGVSDQGVVQAPLRLVEANRVAATTTDKQYADYLGVPVTTARGNVVVEPGTQTYEQLTKSAPQVVEILQFSGLFADANSGTFSSEIRLARLFDNARGTVTYLKGGSLSGSITENFRGARFSKNRVKRAHFSSESRIGEGYYGPEYALLSDVSIVG